MKQCLWTRHGPCSHELTVAMVPCKKKDLRKTGPPPPIFHWLGKEGIMSSHSLREYELFRVALVVSSLTC